MVVRPTESMHVAGDIIAPGCSKDKLWNALADAVNDISVDTTSKKLTSSVDNRFLFVAQNTPTT